MGKYNGIFGLTEGKNFVREYPNETILDISKLENVVIADIDYFMEHTSNIKEALQENKKKWQDRTGVRGVSMIDPGGETVLDPTRPI